MRLFFRGGLIAYRATFNWLQPGVYVPTVLLNPVFQIVFFAYLGRYTGVADDTFFVVGNAMLVGAIPALYGMVAALVNERMFETLSVVIATSTRRAALYYGRALAPIANGVFAAVVGFGAGALLLGFRMPVGALPAALGVIAVATCSCAMFGLALGAVGMRFKDLWLGSNLAYTLMLLVCGVNVPLDQLPGWLAAVGAGLPLTHGIEAVRGLAGGAGLADVAGLVVHEALIGVTYAALGYLLLRVLEAESRRRATLLTV